MSQPYQSPPADDDVDIAALWRAVTAKKFRIVAIMILAGAATYLGLQTVTPLYSSKARILIEYDEPAFTQPRTETGGTVKETRLDPEAVASQVQVLLSRDLAVQVIKELNLQSDPDFSETAGSGGILKGLLSTVGVSGKKPVGSSEEQALETFEEGLAVYQVAKSRVIAIDFDAANPKTGADVANRLAEAYLTWQQSTKLKQTQEATEWLRAEIEKLRGQVQGAEAKVEKFRSEKGLIVAGSNSVTLNAQQLAEVNTQLINAKAQRTEAEARANLIKEMLREKGDVASFGDVLRSGLIQNLIEQQVRVRRQIAELSATLLRSHPRIGQLEADYYDLQFQIRQEARKIVTSLEAEAQIAGTREASLRASLDSLKKRSASANADQIKLRSLEREAKTNRDLLESYMARYREASARNDRSSVPVHASIISRARSASSPSSPKVIPITVLAALGLGVLYLVWVLARELVNGTLARNQQQPPEFNAPQAIPVQSEIAMPHPANATAAPEMAPPPQDEVVAPQPVIAHPAPSEQHDSGPVHAPSVQSAIHAIQPRCTSESAHNVVLVAEGSAAGTAQDTLDIARGLAATGLRVAIIDFTTTDEGVAGLAGIANGPGIADLLAGQVEFENVIAVDPGGSVQIIPPGALQVGYLAGENAQRWFRVHNALIQIYDCIILRAAIGDAQKLLWGVQGEASSVLLPTGQQNDNEFNRQMGEFMAEFAKGRVGVVTYDGSWAIQNAGHLDVFARNSGVPAGAPAST